jgi:hypothetical protein
MSLRENVESRKNMGLGFRQRFASISLATKMLHVLKKTKVSLNNLGEDTIGQTCQGNYQI